MKQEKVWTADDAGWPEDWTDDWGCLLDRLMSDREIENEQDLIGEEYLEGDVDPIPLRKMIPTDAIIEMLNEKAMDIGGEYAEDWLNLKPEDKQELEDLIAGFLEKKHVREFYDVKNIVKKTITEDDIREETE